MSGQRSLEPKPTAAGEEKILQIPEREFIQTRDKIVTGLTTLIGVITELNTAFIKHTNDLANEGGANINSLSSVSIHNFLNTAGKAVTGAGLGGDLVKVKRKRVKKEKDPNAPKRPLTAFFLYSTFARPEVKDELGDVSPVEINNEILKRWKEMAVGEKQTWKERYEDNNKKYKEQVAAYKARTGVDPDVIAGAHEDEEVEEPVVEDEDTSEEDDTEEDEEDEEAEPAKPPTPPPMKAKKAKAAPKAKGKENGAPAVSSPSPSAQLRTSSELPASKDKSPEKRKRGDKEAVEDPKKKKARKADMKDESSPTAEKKLEKKKKRKGEA